MRLEPPSLCAYFDQALTQSTPFYSDSLTQQMYSHHYHRRIPSPEKHSYTVPTSWSYQSRDSFDRFWRHLRLRVVASLGLMLTGLCLVMWTPSGREFRCQLSRTRRVVGIWMFMIGSCCMCSGVIKVVVVGWIDWIIILFSW